MTVVPGLIIMPVPVVEQIDKLVANFRVAYPDATDDDGKHIRQELVNAFAQYGHIPEFTIVRTDDSARSAGVEPDGEAPSTQGHQP